MKKNTIRLTEQDLNYIVENAVRTCLQENGTDEGILGGLGALGSKFGNSMRTAGQNMSNTAGRNFSRARNAISQGVNRAGQTISQGVNRAGQAISQGVNRATDAVGHRVNQASQAMGQAYNNARNTYYTGSANQEAQRAIRNAVSALTDLKNADDKLKNMGQSSVIGKQVGLIDQLISVLSQGGASSISGRFNSRRNALTH